MAKPLCPYYGDCGSCTMQDVDYPAQLESKRKVLADAIQFEDIKVFSANEYYYRNRMDMVFHGGGLGFRRRGKWREIVDIAQCAISRAELNLLIREIREFFKGVDYFDVRKKQGVFRYAVIRTPNEDSSISFILNQDSGKLEEAVEKIREYASVSTAGNVIVAYVPANTDVSISDNFEVIKGDCFLKTVCFGREFLFHVQGFFQNNSKMADIVSEHCYNLLKSYDTRGSCLVDLYGGVGVFGISSAGLFNEVLVVDNNELSIEAAQKNIKNSKTENVKAIMLNAKRLREVELPAGFFVIADPSRQGIHPKAIKHLNNTRAEAIIYISCNAKQLGEDLKKFEGYSVRSAALFDLFPQTPHLESVIELVCCL